MPAASPRCWKPPGNGVPDWWCCPRDACPATASVTGFQVTDSSTRARFEGGLLETHVDLHDRATLTIGLAYDDYDMGVLPHFGVRTLIVDQEHIRFGFHLQSGAWLKLSESDEYDDRTGIGIGWALEAGGERVVVDATRTPFAAHSWESDWDGERYWDPARGEFQELGLSVIYGGHRARLGLLGLTPVAGYTYDHGSWFVRAMGGYAPETDWATYRGFLVSAGVCGELF